MLEIGDRFAGCDVKDKRNGKNGVTWLFVRGNEGVFITASYSDYFDAISLPYEKERFQDQMAQEIARALAEKKRTITSLRSGDDAN